MKLMGLRPYQKGETRTKRNKCDDPAYLRAVRAMPCCICWEYGLKQESPTEAHHFKSERYSRAKARDNRTMPLCHVHHRHKTARAPYPSDAGQVGFHDDQGAWEALYGFDYEWQGWVENRMGLDT